MVIDEIKLVMDEALRVRAALLLLYPEVPTPKKPAILYGDSVEQAFFELRSVIYNCGYLLERLFSEVRV